ncbi:MAG: hypothetical protein KBT04_07190 [Bacteroidales bacterium]|nr:hypothetical protein [Candidatus Colimorpha onthohippi]
MRYTRYIILIILFALLQTACTHNSRPIPKPTAYLRLTYPPHSYQWIDNPELPIRFQIADSATLVVKRCTARESWLDITYPQYDGIIFLTYKSINSQQDLRKQMDDSYEMLKTHFGIAAGIDETTLINNASHVYATAYKLSGKNVASTYQFTATDSTHHFLHGSFYLNRTPNNDSLAPLLSYIQTDIDHLLETLQWK